jgi:hypothetical protein
MRSITVTVSNAEFRKSRSSSAERPLHPNPLSNPVRKTAFSHQN